MCNRIWGTLRETSEQARKAGINRETGLCRTGLDEYLAVIFPNTHDWVHNRNVRDARWPDGKRCQCRPDYRSESRMLIVEFDGTDHYRKPDVIHKDEQTTKVYKSLGYKVVRIPYFIQLTNKAVETMFGVKVNQHLFDETVSSLGAGEGSPAYLCADGIERMARDFKKFPEQYKVNMEAMKNVPMEEKYLCRAELLEAAYNKLQAVGVL